MDREVGAVEIESVGIGILQRFLGDEPVFGAGLEVEGQGADGGGVFTGEVDGEGSDGGGKEAEGNVPIHAVHGAVEGNGEAKTFVMGEGFRRRSSIAWGASFGVEGNRGGEDRRKEEEESSKAPGELLANGHEFIPRYSRTVREILRRWVAVVVQTGGKTYGIPWAWGPGEGCCPSA